MQSYGEELGGLDQMDRTHGKVRGTHTRTHQGSPGNGALLHDTSLIIAVRAKMDFFMRGFGMMYEM